MLCVENILNHCDKTELNMLFSLIDGMTYADLAEKYHMSINGAKYRLHKLFELCHANSKADFVELVKNIFVNSKNRTHQSTMQTDFRYLRMYFHLCILLHPRIFGQSHCNLN